MTAWCRRLHAGSGGEVLKEFYAKASEATALVQQTPGEDAPATFDKPSPG